MRDRQTDRHTGCNFLLTVQCLFDDSRLLLSLIIELMFYNGMTVFSYW